MLKRLIKDIFLMLRKPGIQFLFVCGFERTANTVLADNTSKTQQRRKNRIIAQPVLLPQTAFLSIQLPNLGLRQSLKVCADSDDSIALAAIRQRRSFSGRAGGAKIGERGMGKWEWGQILWCESGFNRVDRVEVGEL